VSLEIRVGDVWEKDGKRVEVVGGGRGQVSTSTVVYPAAKIVAEFTRVLSGRGRRIWSR
jgi:hypothetical protein